VDRVKSVGEPSWSYNTTNNNEHRLDVKIPVTTSSFSSDAQSVIELKVNVVDSKAVYPASYNVTSNKHTKWHSVGGHFGGSVKIIYTTVRVALYAMRGTKIVPQMALPQEHMRPVDIKTHHFGVLTIIIDVYIIQEPSHFPQIGEALNDSKIFPSYEVRPENTRAPAMQTQSFRRFCVKHRPNGVDITWVHTGQVIHLDLPKPKNLMGEEKLDFGYLNGDSGFSFSFNVEGQLQKNNNGDLLYDNLLHIFIWGEIKITLSEIADPVKLRVYSESENTYGIPNEKFKEVKNIPSLSLIFLDPEKWQRNKKPYYAINNANDMKHLNKRYSDWRPLNESRFFRVAKVKRVEQLPVLDSGVRVEGEYFDQSPHYYMSYYNKPNYEEITHLLIDVGVGFIPIVGDLADFAEFNYMLSTGKNKWGEKVSNFEVALQGIAVIPLFGDGIRLLGKFLKKL